MTGIVKRTGLSAFALLLATAAFVGPDARAGDACCATKATVGEKAPNFKLKDLEGKEYNLEDLKGKVVVLEWFNTECPWVDKVYDEGVVQKTYKTLKETFGEDNIAYLTINSTADMPREKVEKLSRRHMRDHNLELPVLMDYSGEVGRMYEAKTTPHMYIIDQEGVLRYHGAIADRSDFDTNYVITALKQMKAGETISPDHVRQWGCGVKYARK